MSRRVRLAPAAARDIAALLDWSAERFGPAARERYEALVLASLRDLAENPHRPGARELTDKRPGVLIYHLRHSRSFTRPPDVVRKPRHLIVYRASVEIVTILRVLHEAMDLTRHASTGFDE